MKPKKFAVLSMDVEDWYHTGYLRKDECVEGHSRLDGLDIFLNQLESHNISAQLFVLGDLVKSEPERFKSAIARGHEVASHGKSHRPPIYVSPLEFHQELKECIQIHKDYLGQDLSGFRASRFMIDRPRLDVVQELGFKYDSSLIDRRQHRNFDFNGFCFHSPHIAEYKGLFEFRPPSFNGWPIAGGGAFRLFPWWMTAIPLQWSLNQIELYSFYIHPIDISPLESPPLPESTSWLSRQRMERGRKSTNAKLQWLINLLKINNFEFTNYSELRSRFTSHQNQLPRSG